MGLQDPRVPSEVQVKLDSVVRMERVELLAVREHQVHLEHQGQPEIREHPGQQDLRDNLVQLDSLDLMAEQVIRANRVL